MRERNRGLYDVERGNGMESRCCVANVEWLRNLKGKTYERLNRDQRTEGLVEERNGSKTRMVKQEDASNIGTDRVSGARGIWEECGWVRVSVQRGEEFVDGEIGSSIGREENVGYVVQGYEFRNKGLSAGSSA